MIWGEGASSAPFRESIRLIFRVRAAQGRVAQSKPTTNKIIVVVKEMDEKLTVMLESK